MLPNKPPVAGAGEPNAGAGAGWPNAGATGNYQQGMREKLIGKMECVFQAKKKNYLEQLQRDLQSVPGLH